MLETAITASLGSFTSLLGCNVVSASKMLRMFFSGFFLAYFAGQDVCNLIQHLFNFTVSSGGVVFFTGYIGSTFLERMIILIKSFKIEVRK